MTHRLLHLGRQVRVLEETTADAQLEGAIQLRPGQLVELVGDGRNGSTRVGLIVSWSVARLGKEGPMYRGVCRWQ